MTELIRIAIQKSGRLYDESRSLLTKAGVDFERGSRRLLLRARGFPAEIMLVRDDDIPQYVADGVCDLGIVGQNILSEEEELSRKVTEVLPLGFGYCRLSIAVPKERSEAQLDGSTIATSYPVTLRRYLDEKKASARVVEIGGAVEIAPALGVADAICDLVSSGATLRSNGLLETDVLLESEAVLIASHDPTPEITRLRERLEGRLRGVLAARASRYVMMNAPASAVEKISGILPGMVSPTVIPLGQSGKQVAIHAVAREDLFWETIDNLKEAGAQSILVMPIEKMIA